LGTPDHIRALVRQTPDGVAIEARDGGGAGYVRAGFETGGLSIEDGRSFGGPPGSLAVIAISRHAVSDMHERSYTIVDGDGVRLDDSLTDRVLGRLGIVGGAAIAL